MNKNCSPEPRCLSICALLGFQVDSKRFEWVLVSLPLSLSLSITLIQLGVPVNSLELYSINKTAPVASMEYWADEARLRAHGGLYTVKKTLTKISFENKTDARVYSTVFMIDGYIFSVRFDFEGRVAVKMTVTLLLL